VFLMFTLLGNVVFLSTFVIPKFEKIFAEFKLKLPALTQQFIDGSRAMRHYGDLLGLSFWGLLGLANWVLFSSWAKWYFPLFGRLYRTRVRGQFLKLLGLMLESEKPLPLILRHVIDSGLLPREVRRRATRLYTELEQGQPLAESLTRHGLATPAMRGLIDAAQKAQNLPWALQELGDALERRSVRLAHRLALALFPLVIFACACLVAFYAVAMFSPLIAMIEGMHG
jgi:type II secretory pathway component PulF